ncbi:uncharacterized protein CBL_11138 [Carabus blaptoides fortunei]
MSSKFIISMPERQDTPHPGGLGVYLVECMQKNRNKIAQIDTATGESQSYAEILAKSITLAQHLESRGITRADVVGLCSSNTPDSCLPLTACLLLGVPIAILDPIFALGDVKHMLNIAKPRLIFCEHGSIPTMEQALAQNALDAELVDLDNTGQCTSFESMLVRTGHEEAFVARPVSNLWDTAIILFSSGTTGLSKGVCLHHYGIMMQLLNFHFVFRESRITNICLSLASLYWISAVMLLMICYTNGQTRVLYKKFDENTIMRVLQDYKVTLCFMAPSQACAITSNPRNLEYNTEALRNIIVGGGFLAKNQHLKMEKFFPHTNVLTSYGMTEAHGMITTFRNEGDDEEGMINKRYESCGRPTPGISYKIADLDTGECLGPNQVGEIRLKSKMFTTGYYNSPETTQEAWDADGFLKTGDVGYYDENWCFFVVDRIKDMFKYRSWHIQPTELETVLLQHPAVKEAAVIGVPHVIDGERPVGFVVLKPGTVASEQEILEFFNDKVSEHKQLQGGLVFLASFPKTPTMNNKKNIISMPEDAKCVPDNRGFGALCFDKMVEFGERTAQIDALTDESLTYKQLLHKCIRVAMAMESMGTQPDDIVMLCTYNSTESYIPILAAQFLGLRVASLDPTLVLDELQHLINIVKPRFVFTVPECTSVIVTALGALNLSSTIIEFGGSKQYISFKSLLEPVEGEATFRPKLAEDIFDTAFIVFSSGTTGMPKGICVSHYGLLYNAAIFERYYCDMQSTLYYTSSYWISHVLCNTMTIMAGGRRIICRDFDAKTVIQYVEKYKVTFMFLAPTATYAMTANEETFNNYNTASFTTMMISGSTIAPAQLNKLRKLLPHTVVTHVYGLTELSGMIAGFPRDRAAEINTYSVGQIIAGMSCKIVDPETNEILGLNQRGELMIKSNTKMNGYYNKEEETRQAVDEDGYIYTGDIGYFDDDNSLHIVDRLKSMFKYKSWHIIPAELESVLMRHQDVLEAVVIGVPHEEDGDVPMAVIIPKPGSQASERDIITYFNKQVNDRKQLRAGVKFVSHLPKTSTGKYNRRSLLKIIMQDRTASMKLV